MAKAKILVVEDEAITAKDLQDELRGLGYDAPAIASSGEGAIKKAEEIKPDLVLMDIVLKGDMDGIEAAELIRDRFDIPVVYVTAYLDEERLEKTKVTEPYGYIIKPFVDNDLRPTIEMALQRHKLEKVLRESEERFRTIVETAPSLLMISDAEGNNIYVSPNCEEITGYTQEELRGRVIWWVHEDDAPMAKELFEHTFREGVGDKNFKYKAVKKNGDLWYASSSWEPLKDEEGFKGVVFQTIDITERKQAEEALQESEGRYRLLAESAQDHIFILDSDMRIQYTNQFAAGLLGYRPEEIIGKHLEEVFPPDLSNRLKHNSQTVFESDELLHVEDRFTLPDKELWLDTRLIPLKTESGEIKSILGISRDITERKRADEALREERDKAQKYLDIAEVMFVIIGADQKVPLVNNKCCGILGYKEEEIIGKNWFDNFIPERIKDEVKTVFQKLMAGEIELTEYFENLILTKSGEERIIAWHNTVLRDKAGNIIGTLSSGEDITERKRVEEALRESEGRFRALTESTSDWIWGVDENAVYTYASPKIKELLGYEPEEIIGKTPFDLMTPEGVKRVAAEFGAIAEAQKPFDRLENENLHKDGQILVLETSGIPIFDANGNFRGYRGIDRDITERKRAETELKEKNEALKSFNKLAVGRELKMVELKKEINALLVQLGKEPRYEIVGES